MEETGFQIAYSIDVGEPPVISRDANICKLNFQYYNSIIFEKHGHFIDQSKI
jgi:hypothetical protein